MLTAASVGSSLNRSADVSTDALLSSEVTLLTDSEPPQLEIAIIPITIIARIKISRIN